VAIPAPLERSLLPEFSSGRISRRPKLRSTPQVRAPENLVGVGFGGLGPARKLRGEVGRRLPEVCSAGDECVEVVLVVTGGEVPRVSRSACRVGASPGLLFPCVLWPVPMGRSFAQRRSPSRAVNVDYGVARLGSRMRGGSVSPLAVKPSSVAAGSASHCLRARGWYETSKVRRSPGPRARAKGHG
jgi:hypothetical protein